MKIGIVCYPTYGGSGVLATELGLGLARKGHHVHFITYRQPARLSHFQENIFYHEVSSADYPLFEYPPYDTALTSKLVDVVKFENLDLLHVHYAIPHAVSAVLAREMLGRSSPAIVTTLHGTDITIVGAERAYFHPTRYGIARSDRVTAVSEWLKRETELVFAPDRPIDVVPNFVDPDRFRPRASAGCRGVLAPAGERVLCHVSNFRPVKRVADVIRIFAGVLAVLPARLVLAGDGPDRAAAEELARELGVAGHVSFLGEQSEVERVLAASDLFLLPSEHESFGLAALEAMACGVPVLGTASGGLPEVVDDGETGALVAVGDVEAAIARAVAILRDDCAPHAMGQRAREVAVARFGVEPVVSRYLDIYEAAIASTS